VPIVGGLISILRLVSEALAPDDSIDVVGGAARGRIALREIDRLAPEVTLDIELPTMDGLATLCAVRKEHPRLHVIMFTPFLAERLSAQSLRTAVDAVEGRDEMHFNASRRRLTDPLDIATRVRRQRVCERATPECQPFR
jgi:chemotaxis response regulator CheB